MQCAAGSERTGGIIYLYRTLVLGESPDAAYAELLGYGHRPNRNPKLEAFLNANMAYFAASSPRAASSALTARLCRISQNRARS